MANMNIHMETGLKSEYSYNLANLRENWAQKKNRPRAYPGIPRVTSNHACSYHEERTQDTWSPTI